MTSKKKMWSLLLFLLFSRVLFSLESPLTLVTGKIPESEAYRYLELVYGEVFNRLNLDLSLEFYPLTRCSQLSDRGEVDGELSRVYQYGAAHPEVLRVEEPHWAIRVFAVTSDPSLELEGWDSLKGTSYRVCYQRGAMLAQNGLEPVVSDDKLDAVDFGSNGLELVLNGRMDIFVISEINYMELVSSDEYKASNLHIAGVMGRYTSHAYLHNKHAELIPRLSLVLGEMKEEGLLLEYRDLTGIFIYEDFFLTD